MWTVLFLSALIGFATAVIVLVVMLFAMLMTAVFMLIVADILMRDQDMPPEDVPDEVSEVLACEEEHEDEGDDLNIVDILMHDQDMPPEDAPDGASEVLVCEEDGEDDGSGEEDSSFAEAFAPVRMHAGSHATSQPLETLSDWEQEWGADEPWVYPKLVLATASNASS